MSAIGIQGNPMAATPTRHIARQFVELFLTSIFVLSIAASGSDPGERMLSGGGIGAGVGVGVALLGAPLLPALLVGSAIGAATGGLTNDKQIDLSR